MAMILLSLSHRVNPLEVIASVANKDSDTRENIVSLPGVEGIFRLSTCNRYEILVDFSDDDVADHREALQEAFYQATGYRDEATLLTGQELVRWVFRVAAGLDSMVVGEREIVAQIRRAYEAAGKGKLLTAQMSRLIRAALHASRAVAVETDVARGGRSMVNVALDLLGREDISRDRILLAGTGAYAGASTHALKQRGATNIRVWSQSDRAKDFAASHGTHVAGDLTEELINADVVVLCRGRELPVLTADIVQPVVAARTERLPVIDLALSGDVDSAVRHFPALDVIDLESIGNNVPQAEDFVLAETIVERAIADYQADEARRGMDPVVVGLRKVISRSLSAEIDAIPKDRELTEYDVERALRRLAAKIAHAPSAAAREAGAAGNGEKFWEAAELVWGERLPKPYVN